ncbi:MAG: T9SS type A sorting domain-containing protein [Bacteroidia bacterium]|nr:T9SS type A sorting domain-containing protein [Bacteroidia bacterium]
MKTSIIAICLVLGVTFGFSFLIPDNEPEKNGTVTIKIVTEKNGVTTVIDTTLSFTGEFNENMISGLLNSYGINESGSNGEKIIKQIIVNTNEEGNDKHMKMVCIKGDTSFTDIIKCCNLSGDSVKICNTKQTCTVICDDKGGSKHKKVIVKSCNGSNSDLEKDVKVEVSEDGTVKTITINGEEVNTENVETDVQVINSKGGKKVIIIKARVNIDDLNESDLKKLEKADVVTSTTKNNLKIEKLDFYPNPNNGKFNLSFNLPDKGNTKITVFDANGKAVYKEVLKDFTGGYNKTIDISSEGKGLYFLNVEQNNKILNKKLVIQ